MHQLEPGLSPLISLIWPSVISNATAPVITGYNTVNQLPLEAILAAHLFDA